MLGDGDGCYGGAMAEACSTVGCVSNEDAHDSGTDDTLAAKYGDRGVPSEFKSLAKSHIVKTASLVKSADDFKVALINGYPGFVCSDYGFTMERNSEGLCHPKGSWAHCMGVVGYWASKGWFCILQSWGKNTPSGPTSNGQPDCSFWIEGEVMDRMVRQRDTWVVSSFNGYKAQTLSWNA
jgi:hypothetical protein